MKDVKEQLEFLAARSVDLHTREELEKKLQVAGKEGRPLRVKYGADPSAPDIHLGHVVGLNKLREFQDAGHTVVFIIGDFTGMIGDPSGRSQTRKPLTKEQVAANAETYKEQVFKILDREKTEIRFNSEWFSPMTFDEVIRLTAHVTVAQMLARDDFSKRYAENAPISLVEFLYPLVQAYDSVMVEADVELGGTDQLFNMLLGRELQKIHGQYPQVVMTLPLLEGLDGVNKMSKSLNNYVGLTEPPQEIFGKMMSVSDDLMWRYYSLVLCRTEEDIEVMKADVASGKVHPRDAKDQLAQAVTARFHDDAGAKAASEAFTRQFTEKKLPSDIPEIRVEEPSMGVLNLLVHAKFASSNGEARRLVQQGGFKVNEEKVTDPTATLTLEDGMIIQAGKRKFGQIKLP